MADEINDLMQRCQAAWRKCDAKHRRESDIGCGEDFQIIHWNFPSRMPWRVGFYEREQGKQVEDGRTLRSALRKWLAYYEHRWDE